MAKEAGCTCHTMSPAQSIVFRWCTIHVSSLLLQFHCLHPWENSFCQNPSMKHHTMTFQLHVLHKFWEKHSFLIGRNSFSLFAVPPWEDPKGKEFQEFLSFPSHSFSFEGTASQENPLDGRKRKGIWRNMKECEGIWRNDALVWLMRALITDIFSL